SRLDGGPRGWITAALGLTNYLREPASPGNEGGQDEVTVGERFRQLANHLARAWALCSGSENLTHLRTTAQFYEEVRVWMAKYDANERQANDQPIPDEIRRMLENLVATSTETAGITDIYAAAGIPRPSLSELDADFTAKAQAASNPHLAIEALRDVLTDESCKV